MRGRGLFIDLDGTLADSLPVMRAAYGRFLDRFGKPATDAEFARLNGPPLAEIVADLARTHALDGTPAALLDIYWALIEDAYREVRPNAGAAELLREAKSRGARTGVVTSSASGLTRRWLERVGLDGLVDLVVGGDDVQRGKPDPEPYRRALERAECAATDSLAVEDSATGARAAVAAGIPTLLVRTVVDPPPSVTVVDGLEGVTALLRDRWAMEGER